MCQTMCRILYTCQALFLWNTLTIIVTGKLADKWILCSEKYNISLWTVVKYHTAKKVHAGVKVKSTSKVIILCYFSPESTAVVFPTPQECKSNLSCLVCNHLMLNLPVATGPRYCSAHSLFTLAFWLYPARVWNSCICSGTNNKRQHDKYLNDRLSSLSTFMWATASQCMSLCKWKKSLSFLHKLKLKQT